MTHEQVDVLIQAYLIQRARCAFLTERIQELEQYLREAEQDQIHDLISINAKMNGEPHGTGISNPTERAGMKLADGYESRDVRELKNNISVLRQYLTVTRRDVTYVDGWMTCLVGQERTITRLRGLEHKTWKDCIAEYEKEYGVYYSEAGLKKMYRKALGRIYSVAAMDISNSYRPAVYLPDMRRVDEEMRRSHEHDEEEGADHSEEPQNDV